MAFRDELTSKLNEVKRVARETNVTETGSLDVLDPVIDTSSWPWIGDRERSDPMRQNRQLSDEDLEARLEDFEARFEIFRHGSLTEFDSMVSALDQNVVGRALVMAKNDDIPFVETQLADWQSAAGDTFRLYYLRRWATAVDFQIAFAQEIGRLLDAYRELLDRIHRDVKQILNDTIDCLRGQAPADSGDRSGQFGILGAVASVARLDPRVGAAIAVASVFHSALRSMTEGARGDGANPPRQVTGERIVDILGAATDAVDKLLELVSSEADIARDAVHEDLGQVSGNLFYVGHDESQGGMVLSRPTVALTPPAGHLGEPLAVDAARLHIAGQGHFPAAAYRYEEAKVNLDAISDRVSTAFGRPSPLGTFGAGNVRMMVERFREALTETRDTLMDVGDNLVTAAANYVQSDATAAALFQTKVDAEEASFESANIPTLGEDRPPEVVLAD